MSIHRRAARRDVNESGIVAALQNVGADVYRLSQPCDLVVRFRGVVHLLEVDNPDSKYRKREDNQKLFLAQWKVPLIQTVDDALKAIGAVK